MIATKRRILFLALALTALSVVLIGIVSVNRAYRATFGYITEENVDRLYWKDLDSILKDFARKHDLELVKDDFGNLPEDIFFARKIINPKLERRPFVALVKGVHNTRNFRVSFYRNNFDSDRQFNEFQARSFHNLSESNLDSQIS